ncbi:sulfur oxidation c-type cytochrome SoxX [Ideonella sp. A 288]|uniref:sulfur oxidation c-type cytochrome SoxX n=1 Tax=Ideonella sp. A 288 TaxID=1962181 RepID=UPI0018FE823F|nr:sulfur oxidation c-type cytochrome SoxX [Ideonella sp. A 288]
MPQPGGLAAMVVGAWLAATTSAAADAPTGDATRGAALVASRSQGLCVLCHAVPGVPASQQGTLAPDLAGAGARWSAAQLRERLVDPERLNPGSLMPSYRRTDGLQRVAPARQGRPLFDAQQLEDVVAYLATLK